MCRSNYSPIQQSIQWKMIFTLWAIFHPNQQLYLHSSCIFSCNCRLNTSTGDCLASFRSPSPSYQACPQQARAQLARPAWATLWPDPIKSKSIRPLYCYTRTHSFFYPGKCVIFWEQAISCFIRSQSDPLRSRVRRRCTRGEQKQRAAGLCRAHRRS